MVLIMLDIPSFTCQAPVPEDVPAVRNCESIGVKKKKKKQHDECPKRNFCSNIFSTIFCKWNIPVDLVVIWVKAGVEVEHHWVCILGMVPSMQHFIAISFHNTFFSDLVSFANHLQ